MTRPYETIYLGTSGSSVFRFLATEGRRSAQLGRLAATAAIVVAPAILLTLVQNGRLPATGLRFHIPSANTNTGCPPH
ncbi:MAG: hypothetical protein WDO73_17365 [Ignavibacteriota bacterium]